MGEDCQIKTERHKEEYFEDEFEVIDILRVLWKWKYLIIVGTVVCGLIGAMISLVMPKVYSIDMVLRPGILDIGEQGKNVYVDSPENIKALIDSGTFNNDILNYLNEIKMEDIPKKLKIKVTIPRNSDTIKVEYETDDIKQGMAIQSHLSELLLGKYTNKLTYFKNKYDMKLYSLKTETDFIKTTIQSYKRNLKNLENRIDDLASEVELIKKNTANLIMERNKLLSKNSTEENILPALLYSNTIQQNLELSNNYQNEINEYRIKKEEELQKIKQSENKINHKLNEILNLKFKKENIQDIQFLQPPTSSLFPVKPKNWLIVILASVGGLFLMIFLAVFSEYLDKHKNKALC